MITGEDIKEAEQTLIRTRDISVIPSSSTLVDRARITHPACDNFVGNLRDDLRKKLPNLDPRFEPVLNTLFRHALMVGCIAGREDMRKNGDES